MNEHEDRGTREDERLSRLIGAVRAEADPFVMTRVRLRLREREAMPAWVGWLQQPRALAFSLALLLGCSVLAVTLSVAGSRAEERRQIAQSLATELASDAWLDGAGGATDTGAAGDSGGAL
jgi:hypothetical protein